MKKMSNKQNDNELNYNCQKNATDAGAREPASARLQQTDVWLWIWPIEGSHDEEQMIFETRCYSFEQLCYLCGYFK